VSGAQVIANRVRPATGFSSVEVAVKVSEIEAVHALLYAAVRGMSVPQLGDQSAPGRNTIGMLLAHVAVSETHLGQVGLLGERDGHVHDVLGIREDDDGLPLPPDGRPPAALADRDLAFFIDLLERALTHTRTCAAGLREADLGTDIVRPPRPDGTQRIFDRRYILFHMVEHAAQHLGQIHSLKR
jgi:uncharacterized damage-inducible protein DinB